MGQAPLRSDISFRSVIFPALLIHTVILYTRIMLIWNTTPTPPDVLTRHSTLEVRDV